MQEFGKFTSYTPTQEEKDKIGPNLPNSVMFIRDDKGNDWYTANKLFKDDTLKIGYDDEGRVRTFATDTGAFFPANLSAVELPATEENLKVTPGNDWFYKDGKLQQIRDYEAIAMAERDRLMRDATVRIEWLSAALEDGDISQNLKHFVLTAPHCAA